MNVFQEQGQNLNQRLRFSQMTKQSESKKSNSQNQVSVFDHYTNQHSEKADSVGAGSSGNYTNVFGFQMKLNVQNLDAPKDVSVFNNVQEGSVIDIYI